MEWKDQFWLTLTREQIEGYAQISGDFNPIHLNDRDAQAAGLPGVIAHGMLSCLLIQNWVREHVIRGSDLWVKKATFKFKHILEPGDEVWISARGDLKTLEVEVKNQKREIVTHSKWTFMKLERESEGREHLSGRHPRIES